MMKASEYLAILATFLAIFTNSTTGRKRCLSPTQSQFSKILLIDSLSQEYGKRPLSILVSQNSNVLDIKEALAQRLGILPQRIAITMVDRDQNLPVLINDDTAPIQKEQFATLLIKPGTIAEPLEVKKIQEKNREEFNVGDIVLVEDKTGIVFGTITRINHDQAEKFLIAIGLKPHPVLKSVYDIRQFSSDQIVGKVL